MIIKCQHTGFEFEAQTARSKNHPMVADFLNDASKDNKYYRGASHVAKAMVSEATGYDTIEELIADVRTAYAAWQETGESHKVVKTHAQMVKAAERKIAWFENRNKYDGETGAW